MAGESIGVAVRGCRLCGGVVHPFLDLGDQPLSGVFPLPGQHVPHGPLVMGQCSRADCGLMQLTHTFPQDLMYGDNYGYRTGLNRSMEMHVRDVARHVLPGVTRLSPDDVVIDIGSNDGTLLAAMPSKCKRIGIDPTASKFKPYYLEEVDSIPEFFPSRTLIEKLGGKKAKVITSIAMFYDVDDPMLFAQSVRDILADDGVWFLELAYLPLMLENTAFDVICHEHACYYGLKQIKKIADATGFVIHNLWLNDTNGGSIAIAMTPNRRQGQAASYMVRGLIESEARMDVTGFLDRVRGLRKSLVALLRDVNGPIVGLGASTKGNVLMHYCGIGTDLVTAISDPNGYKHGRVTSTGIPIISEGDADKLGASHYLVLPWHFRDHFISREFGKRLIFPLPQLEIVNATDHPKYTAA